jgi:large repetitive protein
MKSRSPFFLAGASLALLLLACSSTGSPPDAAPDAAPGAVASASPNDRVRASIAHTDARLGTPSFAFLGRPLGSHPFASADEAAKGALAGIGPAFGLTKEALGSVRLKDVHEPLSSAAGGSIIVRFEQKIGDLEVFRAGLGVVMSRAFEPVAASGFLAPSIAGSETPFALDARGALAVAGAIVDRHRFEHVDTRDGYDRFSATGLYAPARAKKVLFPRRDAAGGVVLAPGHYIEIITSSGPARSFVIAADAGHAGEVLFQHDLTANDAAFKYRAYVDAATKIPLDGPQGNDVAPYPSPKPSGFKPPLGASQLVTLQNYPFSKNDPWLAANATTTNGNNVDAYADLAAPEGYFSADTDLRPTTTSANTFDRLYDASLSPGATPTSIQAATTHLFYVTNFLHDWYYDAGFDEKSGNHQSDNFGRGGMGKDPLHAEAQDYSGRNNADATTPADGESPRIQMFIFSGASAASLAVTSPAPIAGTKPVGIAGFGKDAFDVTGPVALAADGEGADPNDGCEALTGTVTGKIVLVHRGLCSFIQKAQNIQTAGGTGVIIANVASSADPTTPPFMGGTSTAVSLPILSLNVADGQALEGAIGSSPAVTMKRTLQADLDGALDTTVVAHEWGHVLSNRLVGNGNGITTNQAAGLGEGWGDFSALMLIARDSDLLSANGANWAGAYPNGAYATSGGGADFYFGIRRVPYSVDFTKNALTFKHIQNGTPLPADVPTSFGEDGSFNSEVHNTGEVWATMLWEAYVALLRAHPFEDAQARMKRYYVNGLKLTPIDPTLLEARDAVLAAVFASDEQDFALVWGAFARRGAGIGAKGPAKDSSTNAGVVESFLVGNDVEIVDAKLTDDVLSCDHDGILDEGEVGSIEITVRNAGTGTLASTRAEITSRSGGGIAFPDGPGVTFGPLLPFETRSIKVKAVVAGAEPSGPIELDVAVTEPSLAVPRSLHFVLPARLHSDEAAESSAIDRVDTKETSWVVAGTDNVGGQTTKWSRTPPAKEGRWTIPNAMATSDHKLTSAGFTLADGATKFGLAFKHRWFFRSSTRRAADFDGGVVELSVDGGKTWKDVSELATDDYNTTLDSAGRGANPLKGRRAYGKQSLGYPDAWVATKLDITLKEHPEKVQVRFRVGTGDGFGAPGWEIDEIELTAIASKPFWGFVPHADACDPEGPTANAGPGKSVDSHDQVTLTGTATDPKNLPLGFAWAQVAGPAVATSGASTPVLSFEAPDTIDPVTLGFVLRANDGTLLSPASRVDVLVNGDVSYDASGGYACTSATRASGDHAGSSLAALGGVGLLGLAALLRGRRRRRSVPL